MKNAILVFAMALLLCGIAGGAVINGSRAASEGTVISLGTSALPDTTDTVDVVGLWQKLKYIYFVSSDSTTILPVTIYLQHSFDNSHWAIIDSVVVTANDDVGGFDYDYVVSSRYFRAVATSSDTVATVTHWMKIGGR